MRNGAASRQSALGMSAFTLIVGLCFRVGPCRYKWTMAALDLPLITTGEIRVSVGDRVNVYLAGVDVLLAQHIRFVGVTRVDRSEVETAALCVQNSDLHGNPHRLNFTVKFLPNSRKEFGVACSCKAVESVCKHIVALLLHISRNKFADLKEATCTDVTQIWDNIKKQ
ncbi:hypothetical protein QAD02_013061 [Eretmocerus hayati]|uniref:Uncharacterized protein n=1 Tax=Eretmocerus hayati TaxID=131215 RepID=A0ACC2P139_9HYME|nr:hypothetical protein QAD02_013061 [Eretmocerus hayati]